ncbi:hypothetical protein R6Q57_001975 [Mikania cordata]
MNEDMVSLDPIEFHLEEEPYKNRIDAYQRTTGLTEAVQTGIGQLDGINVAIAVMDFQFMGGSIGSVVGEKITCLIEYDTKDFLPLIIVCASGGAHMQEGSLSLMQMAKISSALYDYQSNKKKSRRTLLVSSVTERVAAAQGALFIRRGGLESGLPDRECGPGSIASSFLQPPDGEQTGTPRTDRAFAPVGASHLPPDLSLAELLQVFR